MSDRRAFQKLRLLVQIRALWRRAARGLAEMLPKGLYKRSLLIVIVPMVLLQSAVTFVFMQHHLGSGDPQTVRGGGARRRGANRSLSEAGARSGRCFPSKSGVREVSHGRILAARGSFAPGHASLLLRRIGSAHAHPSEGNQEADQRSPSGSTPSAGRA